MSEAMDFQEMLTEMQTALETPIVVVDKYGIVLASSIPQFSVNSLIPPSVLRTLENKVQMKEDLGLGTVNDIVLEVGTDLLVFTFGQELLFIAQIDPNVNLNEFLPSIDRVVQALDKHTIMSPVPDFLSYDYEQEYSALLVDLQSCVDKKRLDSFKTLISFMVKKK